MVYEAIVIMFCCVMSIHMGLTDAILGVCRLQDKPVPIITCPKCLSFHTVLWFMVFTGHLIIYSIAIAFLMSYAAIWLDLLLGLMDQRYEDIYDSITKDHNDAEVRHEVNRKSEGETSRLPKV